MIIVRTRVHETCVPIVTKPDTSAAKNQNPRSSSAATEFSTSTTGSVCDCALRCKKIAITPTIILSVAATAIVVRTPSVGSNTNPAASVPRIAPARLHAYNRVTEFESRSDDRKRAAASTGNVAPIKVVGTSNTALERTKRQRLKLKYPGWSCCQINAYTLSIQRNNS